MSGHFEKCFVLGAVPISESDWETFHDHYYRISKSITDKKDSLALFNEFRVGTYYDFLLWWDDGLTRDDLFRGASR